MKRKILLLEALTITGLAVGCSKIEMPREIQNPVNQGSSTLAVRSPEGEALFGRNFDWQNCEALIVRLSPSDGYPSISTVNMDFIRSGYGAGISELPDEIRTLIALYAPLSAFPVLDKQLLMEHFDELLTASDLKQEELRRFDE